MRTISICALLALLALLPCSAARAELIMIQLGASVQDSAIDDVISGSISQQGLTITFTANTGQLNATGDYYGINGDGADNSAQLDGASGVSESITITFDRAVEFTQLTLGAYSSGEVGSLTLGLNAPLALPPTIPGLDVYNFSSGDLPLGNFLAVGQAATISYVSGNGFSLEGIQVQTVPEPTMFGLSALAGAYLTFRRRQRGFHAQ